MIRLLTQNDIISSVSRLFSTDKRWVKIKDKSYIPSMDPTKIYIDIYNGRVSKLTDSEIECIRNSKSVFNIFIIRRKILFITIWKEVIK